MKVLGWVRYLFTLAGICLVLVIIAEAVAERYVERSAFRYFPYAVWEYPLRPTANSAGTDDALRVFCMGGSTMYGTGSSGDGQTIASHLARSLNDAGIPSDVTNFGQGGYNSTQEMLRLLQELNSGNIPDVVVMYDGVNDTYASLFSPGRPGVHQNLQAIKGKLSNDRGMAAVNFIKSLASVQLLKNWMVKAGYNKEVMNLANFGGARAAEEPAGSSGQDPTAALAVKAADAEEAYANNVRIVRALGEKYGFRTLFFWQPNIYVTRKVLTESEQRAYDHEDPRLRQACEIMDRRMRDFALPGYRYIGEALDGVDEEFYVDWCHLNDAGNALVARHMALHMTDMLR